MGARRASENIKKVLSIAGSDSVGGAGIQADLKTFLALGAYGGSVITAVTAQNTLSVSQVFVLPEQVVASQLDCVLEDVAWDAVKIGMLGSTAIVKVVAERLSSVTCPIVLDPVMFSKTGHALLDKEGVEAMVEMLLPIATLITPNAMEAEILVKRSVKTKEDALCAAKMLVALGAKAVVVKGGHLSDGGPLCTDLLWDGEKLYELSGPRFESRNTHGTGCTYASAMAVGLAYGLSFLESAQLAKAFVEASLKGALRLRVGRGFGPLNHAAGMRSRKVKRLLRNVFLGT